MAFATADQVAARLGQPLDLLSSEMASQLCDSVTAEIAEAVSKDDAWATALDPVPRLLSALTIEVVARAMGNPTSLASLQEHVGTYSYVQSFRAAAGLMLSSDEQLLARRVVYGRTTESTGEQDSVADMIPFQFPTAGALIDLRELGVDDPVAYLPAGPLD